MKINRNDYLYAILSGILLIISFPSLSFSTVAWLALTPLLIILPGKGFRTAGRLGLLTGFVYFYGLLYWLNALIKFDKVMLLATVVLSLWMALYIAVFAILLTWLLKRYPKGIWWLTPIIWTTLEYIRGMGPLGFPWGSLGYSQAPNLTLIQISSVTGVLGITFLIALCNGIIAQLAIEWRNQQKFYRPSLLRVVLFILLLGIIYTYGSHCLNQHTVNPNQFKAGIVQGNFPQEVKWDEARGKEQFTTHLELTEELAKQQPDVIVWPETAITDIISDSPEDQEKILSIATANNVNILVGTLDGTFTETESIYFNGVYLAAPDWKFSQHYYKTHLVPFGEYLPLESTFPILKKWNVVPSHFTPGQELTVFTLSLASSKQLKLSTLICFESIVPSIARSMVNHGAQALVIVTNDSWFGKTSAPYQHRDMAAFRAIENRVPIIRAANTGYSCFISEKGVITKGLDIYQRGTLLETISLNPQDTLYRKYGDWLPILSGITLFFLIAFNSKSIFTRNPLN